MPEHWEITLMDASVNCYSRQIQTLFIIILTCALRDLWEKFKKDMSVDILYRVRTVNDDNSIKYSDSISIETLFAIEDICLTISNNPLIQLGMVILWRSRNYLYDRDLGKNNNLMLMIYVHLSKQMSNSYLQSKN